MQRKPQYLLGWADASIHEFLLGMGKPPPDMKYALVTCLDSSFDIPTIFQFHNQPAGRRLMFSALGKGAVVTTHQLLSSERRNRRFFGFDELWFFADRPAREKPSNLVITGPDPITPKTFDAFDAWMDDTRCTLGLGDGTGLNYCLRVPSAAGDIVRVLNNVLSRGGTDKRASA